GETFDWRGSFFRKMIKKVLISRFFQKVNEFISIGNKTFQYYQSWGISPVLITKANYCTDPSGFLLGEKEAQFAREQIRKQLNIPQDDFVMLFVGRLFERKRPHDLLRIHQLLDRFKKVHTLIVGNGELSEELKKQSQNLSRVYFPGFQNQKEIKNFYYAADILVVPSEFETWGLVVNEAFACGLPALVTSTCGSAEDLVIPNENGAIFPVGDCNSASQTIERLLVEPNLARVWGTNARKRVLENYTPSHFAASIMTAFQKAISKSI
ncbi:MAG: glycosyltransferase family 1 protein, partial [Proteobacteria bacterium]|nr:glycosyltransferase family 1 protein [Pseudomonadota bacterium]